MLFKKYIDGGWTLAIRPRVVGEELFSECSNTPFQLIKNPWRYWCADPFLINYLGVEYIFCEAFDILKDRGVIAYRTIDKNGHISKLYPCLDTGYHVSYPNIFCHQGQIYMIPETIAAEQIQIYRASHFPDKWEKVAVLVDNISACDTNLFEFQNNWYLLTLILDKTAKATLYDKLYAYIWENDRFSPCQANPLIQNINCARNAGNTFVTEGKLCRVSQNCEKLYGENITFHHILQLSSNSFKEQIIRQVKVGDLLINSKKTFDGIHTYNADKDYEIIDLQRIKWFRLERLIYLISYKIRSIIKNIKLFNHTFKET